MVCPSSKLNDRKSVNGSMCKGESLTKRKGVETLPTPLLVTNTKNLSPTTTGASISFSASSA